MSGLQIGNDETKGRVTRLNGLLTGTFTQNIPESRDKGGAVNPP